LAGLPEGGTQLGERDRLDSLDLCRVDTDGGRCEVVGERLFGDKADSANAVHEVMIGGRRVVIEGTPVVHPATTPDGEGRSADVRRCG
jgi:hypothetical protein